jgi:hypothetical protein
MVVTWALSNVYAQRFDADGMLLGDEMIISGYGPGGITLSPRYGSTAVDMLDDGTFAIAWKEGQSLAYFQQFGADGLPLHEMKLLPDATAGDFDFVQTLGIAYDQSGNLQVMANGDWFIVQSYGANGMPVAEATAGDPMSTRALRFAPSPLGGFTVVY